MQYFLPHDTLLLAPPLPIVEEENFLTKTEKMALVRAGISHSSQPTITEITEYEGDHCIICEIAQGSSLHIPTQFQIFQNTTQNNNLNALKHLWIRPTSESAVLKEAAAALQRLYYTVADISTGSCLGSLSLRRWQGQAWTKPSLKDHSKSSNNNCNVRHPSVKCPFSSY